MYKFNSREEKLVLGVFSELLRMDYSKLNSFLGSATILEMQLLHEKLRYSDYCNRHGKSYEDMTEDDFFRAYEEEQEE